MDCFFSEPLQEEKRIQELRANLARGNHKSATANSSKTWELLLKDVHHGFSLPLPRKAVERIKGAMVQPCGLAHQFSLKADGSRERKHRLTHDLSFEISGKDLSVNSRVDMNRYPEMICGWCLPRIVHFTVALRRAHPGLPIHTAKCDFSNAHRRMAHAGESAAKSIIVMASVVFVALIADSNSLHLPKIKVSRLV